MARRGLYTYPTPVLVVEVTTVDIVSQLDVRTVQRWYVVAEFLRASRFTLRQTVCVTCVEGSYIQTQVHVELRQSSKGNVEFGGSLVEPGVVEAIALVEDASVYAGCSQRKKRIPLGNKIGCWCCGHRRGEEQGTS